SGRPRACVHPRATAISAQEASFGQGRRRTCSSRPATTSITPYLAQRIASASAAKSVMLRKPSATAAARRTGGDQIADSPVGRRRFPSLDQQSAPRRASGTERRRFAAAAYFLAPPVTSESNTRTFFQLARFSSMNFKCLGSVWYLSCEA